jgi:ATP-dependent protease ClpP protease subunit
MHHNIEYHPGIKKVSWHTRPDIVRIHGYVDDEQATRTCKQILELNQSGQDIIPVEIMSEGGDITPTIQIYECIKSCPTPIATIVPSYAASSAVLLFSAGSERYMGPNATLMIHEVQYSPNKDTSFSSSHLCNEVKSCTQTNNQFLGLLAANCEKTQDYFVKLLKQNNNMDTYLTQEEALKYNIATHDYVPVVIDKVSWEFKLEKPNTQNKKRRRF